MDNNELDQLLKSVPTPKKGDDYWKEFPKRVTAKLHWQANRTESTATNSFFTMRRLAGFATGLAAVCVIVGFISARLHNQSGHDAHRDAGQYAEVKKYYEEIEALFPNQMQGIVFDGQGPHLIIADKANIPKSQPFYVRVCSPKGCQGFVTFSGQEIQVNGDKCEVLADANGQIMLVGNKRVWSGNQTSGAIRVEARPLTAML
jgi:hypothetical protein